jgi:ABC transport system ATP-binding/permease protein
MTAKTVSISNPFLQINNQGQVVRIELTLPQHTLGRDRQMADLVVPESWQTISRRQATFRRDGEDYMVFDGDGKTPSSNGLFINGQPINPIVGYRLTNATKFLIGQDPKSLIEVTYFNPISTPQPTSNPAQPQAAVPSSAIKSVVLGSSTVIIGRDISATMQLDAPTISRCHATIDRDPGGRYILRDRSSNGLFVDGQRVQQSMVVAEGAQITIGPFTLTIRGGKLEILDQGDKIQLDVNHLTLESGSKRRLDDLSFSLEPGQFIALVGGSGAGKSTLMRTLLGIEAPTNGIVYLNGTNLRQNFNIYRNQIGYVPQDDIIHKDLTVQEVLAYAAKLRLPSDADIKQVTEQALSDIKMTHRRQALIGELSGGQRKRVSIGVELLANPKLFFLDEPTSGLDPGLDKQLMELLRDLAHQGGRTIVLVTHATDNITECDRIVFLGAGGKLCYFGSPQDSLPFFGAKNFAEIYIKLEATAAIDDYVNRYRQSPYYQKYIANSVSSSFNANGNNTPDAKRANMFSQWWILTQRYFDLVIRDRVSLALALVTAPVGIGLINLALRDKDPFILGSKADATLPGLALQVLLVFTCASLWVGLSSSLQEVVKEAAIYLRERLVNLRIVSYISSKVGVLLGLAVLQTILIILTVGLSFKLRSPELINWIIGMSVTTFLTLTTSFSLGLLVSASVKNGSQANSTFPLILLPQIIFSGVMFKLQAPGTWISWLMLSRWSIGAYGTVINVNNLLPEAMKTGAIADMPFPTGVAYEQTWKNLGMCWLVLIAHTTVYLGITAWLQKRKDIL